MADEIKKDDKKGKATAKDGSKYIDLEPTIDYCRTAVRGKITEWLARRAGGINE